jgi:hypothetical protein
MPLLQSTVEPSCSFLLVQLLVFPQSFLFLGWTCPCWLAFFVTWRVSCLGTSAPSVHSLLVVQSNLMPSVFH